MARARLLLSGFLLVTLITGVFPGCQQLAQPFIDSGKANIANKNYDQDIIDYGRAIAIDSRLASAYTGHGRAYNYQEKYDKALADLNKSIELNSEYGEAYYYRGLCYKALNQFDRARADFQAVAGLAEDTVI